MTPYAELLIRYGGEQGTPERREYNRKYKQEVNKLLLQHMFRRIKASVKKK